jgi:alpha-tubulin suppressor-like RCC1 family protein
VLAVTQRHACGILAAGTLFCSGLNDYGQLGDGTVVPKTAATLVSGGRTYATVTVGGWHSCALTPAGAAYCWGFNTSGEVGTGVFTQTSSWTPQAVKSP